MTKLRFTFSFIIVLFLLVLGIVFTGNSISLYVDTPSLILGILVPYIVISFVFTPAEQVQFNKEIFTPAGSGDKKVLGNALIYFKSYKNMLLSSAVIVTIIGFIGIMAHLEDRTALGPNLAVMMIVPLYIAIFLLIVIEPMRTAAEKNLQG
jgi:flagellar motor component MotA